jgi:hypothetical protein
MSDKYFVIYSSEDGDVSIEAMDKQQLMESISPDATGYSEMRPDEIKNSIDRDRVNLQEDGVGYYIIKGSLVTPKPVTTVTKYEID